MSLRTNTMLCNSLSRILSLLNWRSSLSSEPLGERKLREKKELLWEDAINGTKILELCPDLLEEDLSALIEEQIKRASTDSVQIFARPYVIVDRNGSTDTPILTIGVGDPYTETPHVSYRLGMKKYDFSRVYFEKDEATKYITIYSAYKIGAKEAKGKSGSDRPAWVATIENGMRLLNDLHEGRQAPLKKEEARKMVELNKEAFEACWRGVPDKFKADGKHGRKDKAVQ